MEHKRGFRIVDFIFIFEKEPSAWFPAHVPKTALATERRFLNFVFGLLSRGQVRRLLRISCQFWFPETGPSSSRLPPYIEARRGKFYFNPATNPGPDVEALVRYKTSYLARHFKTQAVSSAVRSRTSAGHSARGVLPAGQTTRVANVQVLNRHNALRKSKQ